MRYRNFGVLATCLVPMGAGAQTYTQAHVEGGSPPYECLASGPSIATTSCTFQDGGGGRALATADMTTYSVFSEAMATGPGLSDASPVGVLASSHAELTGQFRFYGTNLPSAVVFHFALQSLTGHDDSLYPSARVSQVGGGSVGFGYDPFFGGSVGRDPLGGPLTLHLAYADQPVSLTMGTSVQVSARSATSDSALLSLAIDGITPLDANGHALRGAEYTFTPILTTIPEPSSLALLGTGLVGLVPVVGRRRKA